ncbi:uncharacterized protein LOC123865135 [Maniola jurtina]|uniref:uncharacterized protein LOC123865135 n=1 Tax=Maniola jurtina TaxID=191418 RepID=UPI001E687303|nr:uncharacterized protein LOC123865135 [Maniola jurtina]
MKTFFVFTTVFLVSVMVSSSPVDHRPSIPPPPYYPKPPSPLEGGRPDVKGYPHQKPLYPTVRKGEYVCGDKICKLTPGVEPPGCNGICQYPL